jgi:serpin B
MVNGMKQVKPLIAVYLLLYTLGHSSMSLADQPLEVADNGFGFRLFKQLAKDQPHTDISISPYSTATLLQTLSNGAQGKTMAEMQYLLGITQLSSAAVNAANKAIAQSLTSTSTHLILKTANAIWYRPGTVVDPAFISTNQQFYGATVEALNFADPHSVDIINAWASDRTEGKIRRIADGMIDARNTQLFLANALYFKGKWSSPFEARYTNNRAFHLHGGGEKIVPMMQQSNHWEYCQGPGYQAVRLPYEDGNISMYLFLPDIHSAPQTILATLSGDSWQRLSKSGFSSQHVNLVMPKFKVEYSVELRDPLAALGMKAAFSAQSADFSGIAPGIFISAVRHKTFVEVNEEGTEAAAVTGAAATLSAVREIVDMTVDRPFLFLIEDKSTEMILFMGVVFNPADNYIERSR